MGFYSSLAAVNRTTDPGRRSYSATGYLLPNISRGNLKVLTEAMATKIVLDGNVATGVEFAHDGKRHTVKVSKEVVLSAGVIQSPQLLELSGIGDPKVLKAAGVETKIENKRVGKNFQDHVLGGMLYDLRDGLTSLDSLHGVEYAKAQEKIYKETNNGPYGSPGMLMGFVSYASLVDQETLDQTIKEVRQHSIAETEFEKAQEELIIKQLSDPNFANIQTFCKLRISLLNCSPAPNPECRHRRTTRRLPRPKPNRILQCASRGQEPSQLVGVSRTPAIARKRQHYLLRPVQGTLHRHRLSQAPRRRQNPRRRYQMDGQGCSTTSPCKVTWRANSAACIEEHRV
jgi:choline dehydrogenase-like flavoprotein